MQTRTNPLCKARAYLAGGRALIPKNASGWPTLSGLVFERVGRSSLRLAPSGTVQPASAAVQPSILTIHCKTLNNLIPACYPSAVIIINSSAPSRPTFPMCLLNLPAPQRLDVLMVPLVAHSAQFWCSIRPFRINTYNNYESVSKQRTLTTFRMNTYEKQGGWGVLLLTRHATKHVYPERLSGVKDLSSPPAKDFCPRYFGEFCVTPQGGLE